MAAEILGFFVGLVLLLAAGLGPSLWLVRCGRRRVLYALGLAPTVAFALMGILAFPLVRFVGPVSLWAMSVTAGLLLVSVFLSAWDVWRHLAEYRSLAAKPKAWSSWLASTTFVAALFILLVLPVLAGGISYAVYRTNASDTFWYISLAETLRVSSWKALISAAALTQNNWENLTQLANISPTALFTSRFVTDLSVLKDQPTQWYGVQLNNIALLGWLAALGRAETYRFFHLFSLLCYAISAPVMLVVGDWLGWRKLVIWLAILANTVGFWAWYILNSDASASICTVPILWLAVFSWAQLDANNGVSEPRWRWRARLLCALALVAAALLYSPVIFVLGFALVIYYGAELLLRRFDREKVVDIISIGALSLIIVVLTRQADYHLATLLFFDDSVRVNNRFSATALGLFASMGYTILLGIPTSVVKGVIPGVPGNLIFSVLGWTACVGLAILFLFLFYLLVRVRLHSLVRAILAVTLSGLIIALVFVLDDNIRVAFRSFNYVYPFLLFSVVALLVFVQQRVRPAWSQVWGSVLVLWLAAQSIWGLYGLYENVMLSRSRSYYELTPILRYLDDHPPHNLLVFVPRDDDWPFALYSMFALSPYPSYFQSGIIVDNSVDFQNLWFDRLPSTPDYAVIHRDFDYIDAQNLGEPVAASPRLVLYKLKNVGVETFIQQENAYRASEASKPRFPTLDR